MFEELILPVLSIDPAAASAAAELTRNAFCISERTVDGNYARCLTLVGKG